MDFSRRIARVAAIATWGSLLLAVAAATVMDQLGSGDVHIHLTAVYIWGVVGGLNAVALSLLPALQQRSVAVQKSITAWRAGLLITDTIFITGLVSATGGISGPFWLLYIPVVLFAAVSMPAVQASLFGVIAALGVIGASLIAHSFNRDTVGPLLLVAPIFPAVAWFNSTLSTAVWRMRREAKQERDVLTAKVTELSQVLEQAAGGDLGVDIESAVDVGDSTQPIAVLSSSFSHTLGNLRELVGQIRSGGEQIAASAGELLATAEEHAVSATEQSSAVSQTTSTIEELAATAAQIADTAEAVARYAAETLRYAEQGRDAVSLSVDAMDKIAFRVEQI
ncbi:MAG: methyl-accepting chemotaxis protein, partial [Frankia sp.]|nr:methyl-accepting chemotaxis protein [Frankia sp.]